MIMDMNTPIAAIEDIRFTCLLYTSRGLEQEGEYRY